MTTQSLKNLILHPSTQYYFCHPIEFLFFYIQIAQLKLKVVLGKDINFSTNPSSDLPIDVVMPTLDRDYEIVSKVIDSIRTNVRHPIGQIIIISPRSKKIEKMCREKKCRWVHEDSVLPITIQNINIRVKGINRSGWIYQQLLKWGVVRYLKSEYFLISESDTVYARPCVFERNKKMIFACSSALCHIPYFYSYKRLFGEKVLATHNLTSHHLLFRKKYIEEVKRKIESRHKMPWYKAIINILDPDELSSVSDYDSYGQYVSNHYPKTVEFEHWANRSFGRSELKKLPKLLKQYASTTKTLSFHSYDE
jgi:hypothetical protein